MEDKLILTPEQLFVLGSFMDAEYINYSYIAAMGEVQRNYSRIRRKCLDDLTQAGILRERLSGEVTLRPVPKRLLHNVFFGKKETTLEIFTLGKENTHTLFRFHRSDDSVTRVQEKDGALILCPTTDEELAILVERWIVGTETPVPISTIRKENVTCIITAKQATVDVGSSATVLFEQSGSFYTVKDEGEVLGIPVSQARSIILSELKGD